METLKKIIGTIVLIIFISGVILLLIYDAVTPSSYPEDYEDHASYGDF